MKVVIVGAGIIGLAVAEELAHRRAEVTVLEANDEAGQESSFAAAGILSPQGEANGPSPFLELLLAGDRFIQEAVERLQSRTGLDLDYRRDGMLGLAFSEEEQAQLDRNMDWQERAGIVVEKWTAAQVLKREPAVDGPVKGALFWPGNAQIDPAQMLKAYRLLLERQGGVVRVQAPVRRLRMKGNQVTGVEVGSEAVDADWVVNCAGSWASWDEAIPFPIPMIPVRGQMLRFSVDSSWFRRVIHSSGAYLVQRAGGNLIAGTTLEHVGFDRRVTPQGQQAIHRGVSWICSRLASMEPEASWAGLRPDTEDHLPLLGRTPVQGLLLAAGHYRNGILLAPITARIIADLVMGCQPPVDPAPFEVSRFLSKEGKENDSSRSSDTRC